jgi:Putative zinc-finger
VQSDGKGYQATTGACIDAETLAAWADGGLPKAEAAAVEVHLSDCDRCTAMLATLVRTTPEAPVAESLWKRWHLRWLVPVATAATVGALWVLIPRPQPVPTATLDSAETTQAQAPTPSQPSSDVDTKEQETADARTQSRASAFEKREAAKAAPPVEQPRARDEAREELRSAAESTAPVTPPPAREADRADETKTGNLQERAALAAPGAGRAAAPAPAAPRPAAEALRDRNAQAFAAVVAQVVVISPDPMMRWRVVGTGQVERSTTGGARWESATLPESATLTGGSSPAPSICWLVGRTGAMYVTTDGLRFTRVASPDRTDFVSIQATDARRATVVTIDGRTFRTEDQGATWIRIAP